MFPNRNSTTVANCRVDAYLGRSCEITKYLDQNNNINNNNNNNREPASRPGEGIIVAFHECARI